MFLYTRESVSSSCTPSISVIILYPECQRHYPVPRVVIILYPECQCIIILYPECQHHYPVPQVSVSLSCTPSVSVIIPYPKCQRHYPVPRVSVSLSCTPSVSVIILYPKCQRHYPVPRVSVSLSCTPVSVSLSCTLSNHRCGPWGPEDHDDVRQIKLSLKVQPDLLLEDTLCRLPPGARTGEDVVCHVRGKVRVLRLVDATFRALAFAAGDGCPLVPNLRVGAVQFTDILAAGGEGDRSPADSKVPNRGVARMSITPEMVELG
ncbi:unnamed protein product [Ranitomeya imitator]|uniref:Uncharacterized protein n=1 Tax=Ranitomeya imitator TaxID=111125 RepID=A0ABN9M966_9NEOB|nr:unnamed protein product [Ranitomeya imitator]